MVEIKQDLNPMDLTRWNVVTDLKYKMNSLLKFQLDIFVNAVKTDFDCVIIVDGEIEGSGKSVLAQQIGYYLAWRCDRKLALDHIVFNPNQFIEAVETAQRNDCIIWDEAYEGTSKYRQMAGINQTIMRLLQKIRQKNLFIIVVLPYFFDLTSYVAVPRSWCLLHVDIKNQLEVFREQTEIDFEKPVFIRGFFEFYSRRSKKALFFQGRREYNYSYVRANFIGNFPNFYTVDEQAYRDKKLANATESAQATERMDERRWVEECMLRGMPPAILKSYISSMTLRTVYNIRNKLLDSGTLREKEEE